MTGIVILPAGTPDGTMVARQPDVVIVAGDPPQSLAIAAGAQGPTGAQGAIGPAGPAGAASVEINFAFGDATPAPVVTALAGKLIYGVQLHIKVPFDGAGAALVVGDAAQANRLMAADENDVLSIGSNTTAPAYAYAADTQILLSITPGAGATQGLGLLVLSIQQ